MCEVDTGAVVPQAGELADQLTKHMHDFGFEEKVALVSKGSVGQLTASREMTKEEQEKAVAITQEQFNKNDLLRNFKITHLEKV